MLVSAVCRFSTTMPPPQSATVLALSVQLVPPGTDVEVGAQQRHRSGIHGADGVQMLQDLDGAGRVKANVARCTTPLPRR